MPKGIAVHRENVAGVAISNHIIERSRLTRLLDRVEARLIVLVGPAGYGKTTLGRQWVVERGRPSAWYRATATSVDVAALALGLAKAAETIVPGATRRLNQILRTVRDPEQEAEGLAEMLVEDLAAWPTTAWLAIDDYHVIASSRPAESFVDVLARDANLRLLVMTRVRPAWVSARRLLYGEVLEIGHNALAMTHEEAEEVFRNVGEVADPSGLVALAEGWPAVIGLAALTKRGLSGPDADVPAALHAYFADELFQTLPHRLRKGLCFLSLAPSIEAGSAEALLGKNAAATMNAGVRAGFLTSDGNGFELHPLLRQFLELKRLELDTSEISERAERLALWYLKQGLLDEAFAVAHQFSLHRLLGRVMEEGLDRLLTEGRLSSLRHWLEAIRENDPNDPIAEAGQIEIVFREGKWSEACARAEMLAARISERHRLKFRVLYRAGQGAQLSDRTDDALRLLDSAHQHAGSPAEIRKVLWSRFMVLAELEERDDALRTLREFEGQSNPGIEDRLRAIQGRLLLAARWGGIDQEFRTLPDCEELLTLAAKAQDPVVKTGFLQTLCIATCLTARYEVALDIANREFDEARQSRLDFVRPHALTARAGAQFGLRKFRAAVATIHEAARLAVRDDDLHTEVNSIAMFARILLAQGRADRAVSVTDSAWERRPSSGMFGDFLAVRALALACQGTYKEAARYIEASEAVTNHSDGRVIRAFARAVSAIERGDKNSETHVAFAFEEVTSTENFDAFVCAYRAYPQVLRFLCDDKSGAARKLKEVVTRVDQSLAARFGLLSPLAREKETLSKREREVLELLQLGLSNREIGKTLWITEATAKVHVRNILKKLNVRSRTEAAVMGETKRS
jgi:ATP/maltotriose-dependent transcriptional regulator MalT